MTLDNFDDNIVNCAIQALTRMKNPASENADGAINDQPSRTIAVGSTSYWDWFQTAIPKEVAMRNIQTMAPMCSEPTQLVAILIEEARQAGLSPASAVICAGCAHTPYNITSTWYEAAQVMLKALTSVSDGGAK